MVLPIALGLRRRRAQARLTSNVIMARPGKRDRAATRGPLRDGVCLRFAWIWLASRGREDPKRDTAAGAAAAGGNGKTLTRRCLRARTAKGGDCAPHGSTLRSPQ